MQSRPLNIFQMQVNKVTKCLQCFHNSVKPMKSRYDPAFWCKKQHKFIFKMTPTDNCIFFVHDVAMLLKDKEDAKNEMV